MDTSQDITKVDQLSKVIRYVGIENDVFDNLVGIKIMESFMGFIKYSDQNAAGITSDILRSLEELELETE